MQHSSYPTGDNKRTDPSPTSFDMSFGIVDPSAAYDDPALWCHPGGATPETVALSYSSNLAGPQMHQVPPQHGQSHNYTTHELYKNVSPYTTQQTCSVPFTTSYGHSSTYGTPQSTSLSRNPHASANATSATPPETYPAPGQNVSSLGLISLSEAGSQHYVSAYTNVAADAQHIPGVQGPSTRPVTMSFPPLHPTAPSASEYRRTTVEPPKIVAQNPASARQVSERSQSFPGPGYSHELQSQNQGVHIDQFQSTRPPRYRRSHHSHSPYASPTLASPRPPGLTTPEISPVLLTGAHTRGEPSRPGSSRSSSATSSPSSKTATLQPPGPASSSSTYTPTSDARFACPLCRGDRTFSRTKDLERHIHSIHHRDPDAPLWICCGVPLSEADRWALPDWVRRQPPYMFNGVAMVGGCKEQCSRKDVLKRHLKKNGDRCFGSENAPWVPGNQLQQQQQQRRAPRGATASGGSS